METHVSGHARQEELKLLHALIKPRYFMPVHGEFRHLKQHKDLAVQLGMDKTDVFLLATGEVLELTADGARAVGTVPSGQIFVDGLGVGDVGNVVLRDRRILSEDGIILVIVTVEREYGTVVAGPDIISRGFVYVKESENLMDDARSALTKVMARYEGIRDWSGAKNQIRETLKEFVWQRTKRSPMILPIIMEI
jgi:ribonuclease J